MPGHLRQARASYPPSIQRRVEENHVTHIMTDGEKWMLYQVHQGTDRPTSQDGQHGGGGIDGYMRNYGLAQFQREAKKKPPQYVMTHIWLTSLRKSQKERERE